MNNMKYFWSQLRLQQAYYNLVSFNYKQFVTIYAQYLLNYNKCAKV